MTQLSHVSTKDNVTVPCAKWFDVELSFIKLKQLSARRKLIIRFFTTVDKASSLRYVRTDVSKIP